MEYHLPSFSTKINHIRRQNYQAEMKNHDYLSFSLSFLESKRLVVYYHVNRCFF